MHRKAFLFVRSAFFLSSFLALNAADKTADSRAEEARLKNPPGSNYILGPGDEIRVQQQNAEELDGKIARIDANGMVNLGVVGRVQLGGLTVEKAERALTQRLSTLLLDPHPIVTIAEYRSQPVTVLGAVNNPGVLQLQGHKTLIEIIAMAGGFKQDAGNTVRLTRRLEYGTIPGDTAPNDHAPDFSSAQINIQALVGGKTPAANIEILPQDVISVPQTELIYVAGSVRKPGGFPIGMHEGISVLQALSLAEGLSAAAAPGNTLVLRPHDNIAKRQEIPLNLGRMLSGKQPDMQLQSGDILFVPDSTSRKVGYRAAEAALQAVTGVVIYRH